MGTARPEVLKETDTELVMRTKDGGTLASTKLPDGSFHIKNSNGEEAVFSNEDIRKLVENSIGKKKHVKKMRERFQSVTSDPRLKNIKAIGSVHESIGDYEFQSTSIIGSGDLYPKIGRAHV